MDDTAPLEDVPTVTITFGTRKYTGRRLTSDQILAVRSVRDDVGLMLDVLEQLARSAFGHEMFVNHLIDRARGTATVEGFIKLMVAFMDESLKSINAENDEAPAPAPAPPVHHGD